MAKRATSLSIISDFLTGLSNNFVSMLSYLKLAASVTTTTATPSCALQLLKFRSSVRARVSLCACAAHHAGTRSASDIPFRACWTPDLYRNKPIGQETHESRESTPCLAH